MDDGNGLPHEPSCGRPFPSSNAAVKVVREMISLKE
jgi:hypothetical protein